MMIIDFEKAKARKYYMDKTINNFSDSDNGESELDKQHSELVQFYEEWYDNRVVEQDEDGAWVKE